MKRVSLFCLLMIFFIGLPVTVVHAQAQQQQQTLDPGCSPEMWGYLEHQADTIRARNKAYERELLHRQQSTLYMTCFDQALAMSSKLGLIFSDQAYPNPPPANTSVFPNVTYPDWGASQPTLAMDLNTVINPMFNNWLLGGPPNIAPPAYFNFLPQWQLNNNDDAIALIALVQQQIITAIQAWQGADAAQSAAYNALVTTINGIVQALSTTPLEGLPAMNGVFTSLITSLQTLSATIQAGRVTLVGLLVQLALPVISFSDTCTREDDIWDKLDPGYDITKPGVFYPPEGQYWPFTPYYTMKDLLARNPKQGPPWSDPPDTPDFVQELSNATDAAALQQSLKDLGDENVQGLQGATEPLAKIGNSPLWPNVPPLNPPPTAGDVIKNM